MRVLAVEDDAVARLMIEATLRSLGHEVLLANDGEAAWAVVNAEPVRVVVSDWRMAQSDGLELCRRLRARGGDYVYFILLTQVAATEENEQAALEAGVDDFLAKPVNPRELRQRLHVAERILGYTRQVNQLQQFLPICGYCKKIRDDRDYWQQLERFITAQTGARFSHGVCPDCYQRHIVPQLEELDGE